MFDYIIIKQKRKTISILITEEAKVIVKSPRSLSQKQIEEFIMKKEAWILKHLYTVNKNLQNRISWKENDILYYLGEKHCLKHSDGVPYIYEDNIFLNLSDVDNAKKQLIALYKKHGLKILNERVNHYSHVMNVNPKAVKINSAKKRFGSCSTNGVINFSFMNLFMNMACIDYVVVHELSHLLEHNHSTDFYKILNNYYPYDKKEELKKYRSLISLIGF